MDRPTHIVPPIPVTSVAGDSELIGGAAVLVERLDALYDAILDPRRHEARLAGPLRAQHLDAIEKLLFQVTEEMGSGATQLSDTLRAQAELLIGQYRAPPPAPRADRAASHPAA